MVSKANKLFFHITYPIQICYAYAIEAERVYLVSCLAPEVRSDRLKDVAWPKAAGLFGKTDKKTLYFIINNAIVRIYNLGPGYRNLKLRSITY
jgi:hypothetical protein